MTNFAKELQRILDKNKKSMHKFSVECGFAITTIRTIILNDNIPPHLSVQKICENVSPKERDALKKALALDRVECAEKKKIVGKGKAEKEIKEKAATTPEPGNKYPNTAQFDLGDGKILTISLQFKIENTGKKGTL